MSFFVSEEIKDILKDEKKECKYFLKFSEDQNFLLDVLKFKIKKKCTKVTCSLSKSPLDNLIRCEKNIFFCDNAGLNIPVTKDSISVARKNNMYKIKFKLCYSVINIK